MAGILFLVATPIGNLADISLQNRMIRFDVVSVIGRGPDAVLEHLPNAFDAGM